MVMMTLSRLVVDDGDKGLKVVERCWKGMQRGRIGALGFNNGDSR
jgi:hypothetical protein